MALKAYHKWWILAVSLLLAFAVIYLVKPEWLDFILRPSQRTIYERSFKEEPEDLKTWEALTSIAFNDQMVLQDPFSSYAVSATTAYSAGYEIPIQYGEQLVVTIASETKNQWILEIRDENNKLLEDARLKEGVLYASHTPKTSETVRVILQGKLHQASSGFLKIYTQPTYGFPVAGKGNNAIKSFWGASRDGGSRSHEGNDIFAPKKHPVVAISYGSISSIRNRGLGGKQVWVEDYDTGLLHYYAHLDGWNVYEDQMVWRGDTIGYVGNTGNAKNTPPHLHFGIYKNGKAVDPKPFIWQTTIPENSIQLKHTSKARATGVAANLRELPNSTADILQDLKRQEVLILGNCGNWYQVRTTSGMSGFAHQSILELLPD